MQNQSGLGSKVVHRNPDYRDFRLAKVTSTKDYHKLGLLDVVFLDYSQPPPVQVVGDLDREPVSGDTIVVGYLDGRKDAPYMHGFSKNKAYTTNFVVVKKDKIKLQLPIHEIGKKDGIAHEDVKKHLLDNSKQQERAYIELTEEHALVSFPVSKTGAKPPATLKATASEVSIEHPVAGTIKLTASGVEIDHPTGVIKHHGGSAGVARLGDAIEVVIDGVTHTGKITTGSTKTLVD